MNANRVVRLAMLWTCTAVLAAKDLPAAEQTKPQKASMEMVLQKRYLNVPVNNRAPGRSMRLMVDGDLLGNFRIPLAEEKPDWWAFFDVARFKGRKLVVNVTPAPNDWKIISQDDVIRGAEDLYKEKYRPQFHFTTRRGWINDPNGLIYYKGEYHLYYQHNPAALPWGNMTWGHAVSNDLVHWKEEPKVLFPNPTGTCFSGAAFIDRKNQLGFKTGEEDVIVAFYLRTSIGLCLTHSNDRGRTFTDYRHNPVLAHAGARIDTPRPFWYEPTKRWVTPTYDFFTNKDGKRLRCVGFYSSENLKDWKYESRVEQDGWGDELCGCVDFFQLPVDGDPEKKKWVMILIDGSYIVGTFDGYTFYTLSGKPAVTEDRVRSLVICGNFYATQSWHNMPQDRRVQITWMRGGKYPGMPFNGQFTLPAELTLHATDEGPRLRMNPIKELETLRAKTHQWTDLALKAGENPLAAIQGDLFDLEVEFEPAANTQTTFELRGHKVVYDAQAQTLSSGGIRTPLKPDAGVIHLRMLLDRTSIEVFGNHGRVYLPLCIIPKDDDRSLSATCGNGEVKASLLRVHELKSAWK
ncbi:MAG: glycoside hydrolase family 32 protein [Candidatus Nealsonbacteria bacterium]|nr:glycoside hydrolase family 32 protein [Candidatus Nealsonbacteria bacterium]